MQNFRTVLIKDSKIADLTDELAFAVHSGAQNCTYQPFSAVSESNSAINFNVQVPSQSILMSREVLMQSSIAWTVAIQAVAGSPFEVGATVFNYGQTSSLACFPMSKLFNTVTSTINNTNVSINLQDVLPSLLRMNDSRTLYKYNSTTASFPDQAYLNYADAPLTNNNPMAGYGVGSYDVDLLPRGSFPLLRSELFRYTDASGAVPADQSPIVTGVAGERWMIYQSALVTEPIFLSPFIFGDPEYNCGAIAGLNTLTLNFTVDTTCKRFFSVAYPPFLGSPGTPVAQPLQVSLGWVAPPLNFGGLPTGLEARQGFRETKLLLQFLSTQPSDGAMSRIVTPYMDYPRYLSSTNSQSAIPAFAGRVPGQATLTSQNIQLNQLPDLFMICVRIPMNQQTVFQGDTFLTIDRISVNLNNQSGLLSSASQQDLWKISQANGSTQSFIEFGGRSWCVDNPLGTGHLVPTTGSLLILSPTKDLSLPDQFSSSSIGQFIFQFSISVSNFYSYPVAPEIVVICANSGIFVTQAGESNIYSGVLTQEMVMKAKEEHPKDTLHSAEYQRMVGGKMHQRASAVIGRMIKRYHRGQKSYAPSEEEEEMGGAGFSGGARRKGGIKHRLARHFA